MDVFGTQLSELIGLVERNVGQYQNAVFIYCKTLRGAIPETGHNSSGHKELRTQLLTTQLLRTQLLRTQCLRTQWLRTQLLRTQWLRTQRLRTQWLRTQ